MPPIVVIPIAISFAITGLSYAYQRFTQKPLKAGERNFQIQLTDTKTYVPTAYGKVKIGIEKIYAKSIGNDQKLFWLVGSICTGEIEEILAAWFDDKQIVDYEAGETQADIDNDWKSKANLWFRKGTDTQTVFTALQDAVGSDEWSSNRRGRGIAHVYAQFGFDLDLFPSGLPEIFLLIKASKVYDPRDATQSMADRTTWKYSDNNALCLLHYMTGGVDSGGNVRFGLGAIISADAAVNEIDIPSWIAAANYCDETVSVGTLEPPRACKASLEKDTKSETLTTAGSPVTVTLAAAPVSGSLSVYYNTTDGDSLPSTQRLFEITDYTISGTTITFASLSAGVSVTCNYKISVGGNLSANKEYKYLVTFVTAAGETTAGGKSKTVKTTSAIKKARLRDIPINKSSSVTARKIYRAKKSSGVWGDFRLLTTLSDNTTTKYNDNTADSLAVVNPPGTNTATATQKRYTCNGIVDNSQDVNTNIAALENSFRAKVIYEGGLFSVHIKRATIPETFELNEDNITGNWKWETKGMRDTCNMIEASFINPDKKYETDYVHWPKKRAENVYLADDNYFENPKKIDLLFTDNRKTARQIAQLERKESRGKVFASCSVKQAAFVLRVGNLANTSHSTPGWTQKPLWVVSLGLLQSGDMQVGLEDYDATDYDYETLDADTDGTPDTDLPDPQEAPDEVSGVTLSEETYYSKDRTKWRLKIQFTDPKSTLWDHSEVHVKVGAGREYEYRTRIDKNSKGVFYIEDLLDYTTYYIKILSVATLGAKAGLDTATEWSHTTTNVAAPPDVTGFQVQSQRNDVVTLRWDQIKNTDGGIPADFDLYEIQENSTWQTGGTYIVRTKATSYTLSNVSSGTHTYLIKGRDKSRRDSNNNIIDGQESTNAVSCSVTVTAVSSEELSESNNFGTGTHNGTEQYNHGTYGLILRMKQNYLSGDNINFEGGIGTWVLGSGWSRTGAVSTVTPKNGSYMIMCPAYANGSYSGLTGGGLEAVAGKQYIFKAWVWCNKPSTARIALLVDSSGTTYSAYHPGDSQWHILFAVKTVATPAGTPTVYFTTENTFPTATSFFDYCGFARFYGDYISPTYDLGSIDTRRFWLEYDEVSTSTGEAPPGWYLIDLLISDNGSDWSTYPGLGSTEQIVSGRYAKYRIAFFAMWIDQTLYIKAMVSGDGLKAGNPSGMIENSFYIPLGNIVIGEG